MQLRLQTGFTLLELIVVVAIFALVGAVAVPALSNMARRDGVKSDVRNLKEAFSQSKMKAIELNRSVSMAFDCYGRDYMAFVDETHNCEYDAGTDVVLLEGRLKYSSFDAGKSDDGLTFVDNDNGYPAFRWDGRGYTHGASGGFGAGTAYLSGSGAKYKVVVSSTGNIRIEPYQ